MNQALKQQHLKQSLLEERSIFNTAQEGYRTWHLAAKQAGLPVSLWQNKLKQLSGTHQKNSAIDNYLSKTQKIPRRTMLIVKPYTISKAGITFDATAAKALLRWASRGNTVILLDDFQRAGGSTIASALGVRVETVAGNNTENPINSNSGRLIKVANPQNPQLFRHVNAAIRSNTKQAFRFTDPKPNTNRGKQNSSSSPEVLLANTENQPVLLRYQWYEGSVIIGTPTDLAENSWLSKSGAGNYQFLNNLLELEGKPVLVNEYVHGYVKQNNVFAYYWAKPVVQVLFVQLLLLGLMILWRGSFSFYKQGWNGQVAPSDDDPVSGVLSNANSYTNSYNNRVVTTARYYERHQAAVLLLKEPFEAIQRKLPASINPAFSESENQKQFFVSLALTLEKNGFYTQNSLGILPNLSNRYLTRLCKLGTPQKRSETLQSILNHVKQVIESEQRINPKELLQLYQFLNMIVLAITSEKNASLREGPLHGIRVV
ncbi:MAG: DUF4350 domain-containing protein [Cyanobacteria bacterium P01_H01_bin.74]